jgi:pimeloyl-ACP methyl ester carboxylesterase
VLLLHGWGDSKEIWRPTIAALAGEARAVAPDLPGHGGSPLAGAGRMPQLAERVERLAHATGLVPFDLVGHSMGGNVALELALAHPELVRRLVLVAPAALAPEMPRYTRIYLHPAAGWAALRATLALYGRLAALAQHIPAGAELPYAALLRRSAGAVAHDPESLRVVLRGLFDNPLGRRLHEVRAPTLVVSGELDVVVPPALSRRVAQAIPGGRYVGIPRATHHPMDDRPREFERVVLDFLS